MILGSCFAAEIGKKMIEAGYDVCLNPFGTLFNPASICNSIDRMESGRPFTEEECVPMGAGAGKICSFSHHTSFAREKASDFLDVANEALAAASSYWKEAGNVIVTLGTACVWRYKASGLIVSNCLKRPGYEFSHELLSLEEIRGMLEKLVIAHSDKRFIFTISPIRHMGDGAHANTVSKSTLHLAVHSLQSRAEYFPAYEIMLDELRDYRWFAADKVHPSPEAVEVIWKRFSDEILSDAA